MSMIKLALQNFKNSFRSYIALVLSLSFTILVLFNFQSLLSSEAFVVLGTKNKENIDVLIQVISVVLGCFMFFFVWYATNVFLTKRKKEIGIYIFMGMTNEKIGRLYAIECTMIGVSALVIGITFGILSTQLFQMILLAISDITVAIHFQFSIRAAVLTTIVYAGMYFIFVVKGYVNIVRSSVLDMVSANRQNEYVKQKQGILITKSVIGIGILGAGFFLAVKDGGQEVIGNVLAAVILVIIGVYLLFGGFLPLLFQGLANNKSFLYKKTRTLWINNVIFRMKKNYRTYAIVCVLMLCSVTALATGFAMKNKYENLMHFRMMYSIQLLSSLDDLDENTRAVIEQDNDIAFATDATVLSIDKLKITGVDDADSALFVSYQQMKQIADEANLEFEMSEPKDDELIKVSSIKVMSLMDSSVGNVITVDGNSYREMADINTPFLGYLQEQMTLYMVNEKQYQKLQRTGQQLYSYNYKFADPYNFAVSRNKLDHVLVNDENTYTGRVAIDPNDDEIAWLKVLYSICVFMFMVFIFASGCILFMKLYNDAFDEKERYFVMKKMGFDIIKLRQVIRRELLTSYMMPFVVMAVGSYFSVHALGNMMNTNLLSINVISILVTLVVFILFYAISVVAYEKNSGV
ncbi:MAG: ABC transporter permease [Lachnospiraceae bacterium]